MHLFRHAALILVAATLAACGGGRDTRKEIEGNNTGGIIPAPLVKGGNAQALADAHCARWKSTARITFSAAESGGDVVFVCEVGGQPALMAPPGPTQAPATKQAPAPVKR